jgi:hypothetical protein
LKSAKTNDLLIEYDRSTRRTRQFLTFEDSKRLDAQNERQRIELDLLSRGLLLEREIVLLEALDEQDLRRTHDRYFENLPEQAVGEPPRS